MLYKDGFTKNSFSGNTTLYLPSIPDSWTAKEAVLEISYGRYELYIDDIKNGFQKIYSLKKSLGVNSSPPKIGISRFSKGKVLSISLGFPINVNTDIELLKSNANRLGIKIEEVSSSGIGYSI